MYPRCIRYPARAQEFAAARTMLFYFRCSGPPSSLSLSLSLHRISITKQPLARSRAHFVKQIMIETRRAHERGIFICVYSVISVRERDRQINGRSIIASRFPRHYLPLLSVPLLSSCQRWNYISLRARFIIYISRGLMNSPLACDGCIIVCHFFCWVDCCGRG